MSETPDPIDPHMLETQAAIAAARHMPAPEERSSLGKFIVGFFVVYACLVVLGELFYDGDIFIGRETPTHSIVKACNASFRAHPFSGSFTADVSTVASPFTDADANTTFKLLEDGGFTLTDATRKYRDELVYNDFVIEGSRDASKLWPEILRKDSCNVKIILKGNKVTGAMAEAQRVMIGSTTAGKNTVAAAVVKSQPAQAVADVLNTVIDNAKPVAAAMAPPRPMTPEEYGTMPGHIKP